MSEPCYESTGCVDGPLTFTTWCVPQSGTQEGKRKAVAGALGGEEEDEGSRLQEEEERRISALMKGMASAGMEEVTLACSPPFH